MTHDLATLYFVLSKVQMPFLDENIFRFVFSIGDSIITLRTPRLKNGAFSMPYKTSKQIFPKSVSNPAYRSFKIQIFIIDQINDTTTSGLIKLKPEDYLNKSSINLEPYQLTIENIEVTVTFGLSLVKGNAPPPSNFKDFPSTTKETSVEQRKRKVPPTNPQKEDANENNDVELELLEDDFEEEEVKEKKKQIQSPPQNEEVRKHRHHRSEQHSEHQHESRSSSNNSSSSKTEGDSERRHRRRRVDQSNQNPNSDGDNGHSHRRRSHESNPEPPPKEENEGSGRRHRRKKTPEISETPQSNAIKSDGENSKRHRKKSRSSNED